jgi:DNA-binding transcriptional LysR family regulator
MIWLLATPLTGFVLHGFLMAVLIGHLKVFLDLVETKSFTLTAQKNGISQAAVTNELQSMEHHFNERFVERNTRAFRLTQEGKILRDYARKIVRTYTKFKSQFEAIPQPVSNTIHITTIPYIGLYSLPSCLQQFQEKHPQVSALVEYTHVDQVYEDVLNGTADLGLVARPLKNQMIEIIPLHKEPLVLICHPKHRFAKQKKIKLRAFRGETFISFERGLLGYKVLEELLQRYRLRKKYVREFNEIEPIKRAVEIGAGVAIVPEVTVQQEVAYRKLVALTIEDGDLCQLLAAICLKKKAGSPLVKQFITFLKGAFRPSV